MLYFDNYNRRGIFIYNLFLNTTCTHYTKCSFYYNFYFYDTLFLAPGSYDVEKSEKIVHQSSGAVTFGIKYKDQKLDDIPGKSYIVLY